jgi:hypothetical protein
MNRRIGWASGLLAIVAIGLGAAYVHSLRTEPLTSLIACMRVEPHWIGWTCERAIYGFHLTPAEVQQLNRHAGIIHAVSLREPQASEQLLKFFLAQGVDINAVDEETGNTALHTLVSSREEVGIRLLLKHGARTDIRDRNGLTATEKTRRLQAKHPEVNYGPIAQLLENPR